MKNNYKSVLGFHSFDDFIATILGFKAMVVNFWLVFIFSFTAFIGDYIWDSSTSVYTLLALMLGDWVVGVHLAIRASFLLKYRKDTLTKEQVLQLSKRRFSSSRFPRIFVVVPLSLFVLSISWNLAKSNTIYYFLPSVIYGGITGTYLISLIENAAELGVLPKDIVILIKEKLNISHWLKNKK